MQLISGLGSDMEEVDELMSQGEFKLAVTKMIALEERISKVREVGFGEVYNLKKQKFKKSNGCFELLLNMFCCP
jgi:hypothetical protein